MKAVSIIFLFLTGTYWPALSSSRSLCGASPKLKEQFEVFPFFDATKCDKHFNFGVAMGETFSRQILERISSSDQVQRLMRFIETLEGKNIFDALVQANKDLFADYWEELKGIARGSGAKLNEIIVLNLRQELSMHLSIRVTDDCSDVLIRGKDGALIAHNEDMTSDTVNRTYLVHAKLAGREWLAYTYAGELPSSAFGFNDAGIAFSLNAVFPSKPLPVGLARNLASRSLLDADSLEDALRRILVPGQSGGHNYNLMDMASQRLLNVEVGPGNASSVKEIGAGESYFHANMYQHLEVPQNLDESSVHRVKRASEYPDPKTAEDALYLLGDTEDLGWPIFRSGDGDVYTLCTALFDLKEQQLTIYTGNPRNKTVAFVSSFGFGTIGIRADSPNQLTSEA